MLLRHSLEVESRDTDQLIQLAQGMRGVGSGSNPAGTTRKVPEVLQRCYRGTPLSASRMLRRALIPCGTPGCEALVERHVAVAAARRAGRATLAASDGCGACCSPIPQRPQQAAIQLTYVADVLQGYRPILRRQAEFTTTREATLLGTGNAEVAADRAFAAALQRLPLDVVNAATAPAGNHSARIKVQLGYGEECLSPNPALPGELNRGATLRRGRAGLVV